MDKKYTKYTNELRELKIKCEAEDRQPTDPEIERAEYLLDMLDGFDDASGIIGSEPADLEKRNALLPGPSGYKRSTGKPYAMRSPADNKDYRSLFGAGEGISWEHKDMTFWEALFSGRAHPGLQGRAMIEGIGSDGGFLVPTEFAKQIHEVSLENEIVMPRCFVQPMKSNAIKIPAFEIGSHAAHLYGGFSASYKAETASLTEANPKVRSMELNAAKLTGYLRMSNELVADADSDKIAQVCGNGLGWYRDKAFLTGTGAGQPQGVLNANCLIVASKEVGQAASTIIYENLTNMLARLHPACVKNSVWVCHQSTIPQLLGLSIAVGAGGSFYPVLSESSGQYRMLTRPVIFTEKTETLGTQGDILLADFSQYIVGLREGMRIDHSIHVHFSTDELVTRLIERHDGQALWDEALTLKDGSTTVSPFVTLEDR